MTRNVRAVWVAILLFWAALIVSLLFYQHPPVWPDEATFADTAYSLAQGRGFATPSLAGQVEGAGRHLAWTGPLHTMLTAALFAVAGPGVEVMRVLSIVAAAIALAATALITSRMAGPVAALVAVSVLLVDARFLRVALVGRMDVLAMACAFLALWFWSRVDARGDTARSATLAGLCAGLAVSAHPAGAIAPLAIAAEALVTRTAGWRAAGWAAAGCAAGLLPYAALVLLDPGLFFSQLALQLERKRGLTDSAFAQITWNLDSRLVVGLILWVIFAAAMIAMLREWRAREARLVFAAGVAALAVNIAGPEVMYVAWLMIPAAMGIGVIFVRARAVPRLSRVAMPTLILFIAANGAYMAALMARSLTRDYRAFAASLDRCVFTPAPDGTAILINSLPEAYFAVIRDRDRLDVRLPSPVTDAAGIARVAADIDAVVEGPIAHHPGWSSAIRADGDLWVATALRPAGGYRATLFTRRGTTIVLPPGCADDGSSSRPVPRP